MKSVRREQRPRHALLVLRSSTRTCLTHRALLALASAQKRTKKNDFTSAANWLIEFHQRIEWVFSFKFKVGLLSHLSLNIITLFYYPLSHCDLQNLPHGGCLHPVLSWNTSEPEETCHPRPDRGQETVTPEKKQVSTSLINSCFYCYRCKTRIVSPHDILHWFSVLLISLRSTWMLLFLPELMQRWMLSRTMH